MKYAIFISTNLTTNLNLVAEDLETLKYSQIASIRLQIFPALLATFRRGIIPITLNPQTDSLNSIDKLILSNTKFCCFGKISFENSDFKNTALECTNIALVCKIKQIGLIVNYSDNWCDYNKNIDLDSNEIEKQRNNIISGIYKTLLHHADIIITACNAQKQLTYKWKTSDAIIKVIYDPLEGDQLPFKPLEKGEKVKIIWFGHYSNYCFLEKALKSSIINVFSPAPIQLDILTNAPQGRSNLIWLKDLKAKSNWSINIRNWTLDLFYETIKQSHISIIPSDSMCTRKSLSSHNRATQSIHNGCVTIATPIDSYRELKDCILIGEDFADMIENCIINYTTFKSRAEENREKILSKFSPDNNINDWEEIIILFNS